MADERLTLEFDVQGVDRVMGLYRAASQAVGGMGSPGGLLNIADVVTQARELSGASLRVLGVVGGVVGALVAIGAAARHAAQALMSFGNLQNQLGSSVQSAGFLQTIGRGLGIGDMGALAHQLRMSATQGMGAVAGGALGIGFSPFDVGSALDESQALIRLLGQIREFHIQGRDAEMRTYLRNLGMGHLEMAKFIDEETMALIRREQQSRAALFSEEHMTRAVRLNVAMGQLRTAWDDLVTELGTRAIPFILWGVNMLRQLIPHTRGAEDPRTAAERDHTAAMRAHTQALQDVAIGAYGPRAEAAVPRAFRGAGIAMGDSFVQAAMRWGSYAVTL